MLKLWRTVLQPIDNFLNNITMYRLVLYYLVVLLGWACIGSVLGWLPFSVFALLFSVAFLLFVSVFANDLFSWAFGAMQNVESVYISALILALIIAPIKSLEDLPFLFWAAVWMVASKFLFALHKKHLFNPVAIAVVITMLALNRSANWWVGSSVMLPLVFAGGLLIVRKIRRSDLVFTFLGSSLLTIVLLTLLNSTQPFRLVTPFIILQKALIDSPIFFFAFVMLTEPLTTPPTQKLRMWYGILTGILFSPQVHLGSFYTTPELALVIGNIFSYVVSPRVKTLLMLKEKVQLSRDTYDFIFIPDRHFDFTPGQYLEWTLGHEHPDSRGNRRYFTLASSPTENEVIIGVKFYENSSSYKKALLNLQSGQTMMIDQLAGDFTLPENAQQKLVFIAGGIGVTPFRSMIKFLIDTQQSRNIIQFYANKTEDEIVYKDIFDVAQARLGIPTLYLLSDKGHVPSGWNGLVGRLTPEMIQQNVPDYMERVFYLSGPHAMVTAYETVLHDLGVPLAQIKTDFFPGFA